MDREEFLQRALEERIQRADEIAGLLEAGRRAYAAAKLQAEPDWFRLERDLDQVRFPDSDDPEAREVVRRYLLRADPPAGWAWDQPAIFEAIEGNGPKALRGLRVRGPDRHVVDLYNTVREVDYWLAAPDSIGAAVAYEGLLAELPVPPSWVKQAWFLHAGAPKSFDRSDLTDHFEGIWGIRDGRPTWGWLAALQSYMFAARGRKTGWLKFDIVEE